MENKMWINFQQVLCLISVDIYGFDDLFMTYECDFTTDQVIA